MKKLFILLFPFLISNIFYAQIQLTDSIKTDSIRIESIKIDSTKIDSEKIDITKSKCTQVLRGVVKDLKNGNTVPNAFVQLFDGIELIGSKQTGEDAGFSFNVQCNKRFNVKAKAENYALNSAIVFSTKFQKDKIWDVRLFPIREFKYQAPYKLIDVDNITFIHDKTIFTEEAIKQLDKVISIIDKYPEIKVSINVHTDSNGIAEYNLKMTQDRADSILSYLIDNGIDPERLGAIGFGSTQLLNGCTPEVKCFESQHRINRRTEFVVI